MTEQIAAMRRENAILTDPAATKIMLMPQKIVAPELVAMWQHENGIVVSGRKVPMPAANHVLQLWLIPKAPGAKPMPSMALRPDANGKFVMVVAHPPDPSGIKALAITEEPGGWESTAYQRDTLDGSDDLDFRGVEIICRNAAAGAFCGAPRLPCSDASLPRFSIATGGRPWVAWCVHL